MESRELTALMRESVEEGVYKIIGAVFNNCNPYIT